MRKNKLMKVKLKKFHKNGIVWFNSLALSLLPLYEVLKDSLISIQSYVSPDTYKYVGLAVVVMNIILHYTRKDDDGDSNNSETSVDSSS